MRALASHQCCAGSNQSVDAICGLSLLLVLSFAPRGFSPARSEKPDSICISVNFPKCATEGSFPSALLIPAGYIAHAQYNVQLPVTSPFLPSWTLIGNLSNGDSDVKCWQISLELNSKGLYQISGKEKENCCFVFPSSTKREIRHFHVVIEQRGQRNVQKSVMHVQSCYLINLNLLVYCRSRCRRRRRCFSSLLCRDLTALSRGLLT